MRDENKNNSTPTLLILMMEGFAQTNKGTIILVHGAWHGARCWYKLAPGLQARGFHVIAIDLPSDGKDSTNPENVTFKMCVDKVKQVAQNVTGQVTLVGHSMAGTVISQAAEELGVSKVAKLVYLDAFLPKDGESVGMLAVLIESALPKDSNRISINDGLILNDKKNVATLFI